MENVQLLRRSFSAFSKRVRLIKPIQKSSSKGAAIAYRLMEVIASAFALLISLPVMLVIAVLVKATTPGPVIFTHKRIGLNGKPFNFRKFRTHYVDGKERFPDWSHYQYSDEELKDVKLQEENDPRVTPIGRWLRRTSLDELPNFWHVLTGDMALVGPRPEMLEMYKYYKGEQLEKFTVKPGITGYAQIFGRGTLTFLETIRYDLTYIQERSVLIDLKVIFTTIRQVINKESAF